MRWHTNLTVAGLMLAVLTLPACRGEEPASVATEPVQGPSFLKSGEPSDRGPDSPGDPSMNPAIVSGFIDPNHEPNPDAVSPWPVPEVPEVEGYTSVTFKQLGDFEFRIDKPLPEQVSKLHGKPIVMAGYMYPMDFENNRTNEFLLLSVMPGCLHCAVPRINDVVFVKMADGKRIPYEPFEPVVVTGTLDASPEIVDGLIESLYRVSARGVKVMPLPQ